MTDFRCLVIGLDSFDAALASRWMDAGRLPALAALRDGAAHGPISQPPCLGNDAVWTSFHSGASLGRHGRFHPSRIPPGGDRVEPLGPGDARVRPCWEWLGDAGRRVAVLDAPKAWLAQRLNGIQLVDWDVQDRPHAGSPRSIPAGYAAEVVARWGSDPAGPTDRWARRPADVRALRDALVARTDGTTGAGVDLLGREAWDFAFVGFSAIHRSGHLLWHQHDPEHPEHDAELARELGDPLLAVAEATDRGVGRLLEAAGRDMTVLVVLMPGMGPRASASQLLDAVLRRLEPEAVRPPAAWRALRELRRRLLPRRLPAWLRGVAHRTSEATLDRSRRRAYAVPHTEHAGAIRCNLVGRERHGRVAPGAEYEQWCKETEQQLLALVEADTGLPVVKRVVRSDALHAGPARDALPDLWVEWCSDGPIHGVRSERVGSLRRSPDGPRTGDHRERGLYLLRGPDVTPGVRPEPVPVEAFAPSLAARLGVTLPEADAEPLAWLRP